MDKYDLRELADWVHQLNKSNRHRKISCWQLKERLGGFYRKSILKNAYYVIVEDELPFPKHLPFINPQLIADLSQMDAITYRDTYYIKRKFASDIRLHFHELVHVIQWDRLGVKKFLTRYLSEIQANGYQNAPLELIAHELDTAYSNAPSNHFDVKKIVKADLRNNKS